MKYTPNIKPLLGSIGCLGIAAATSVIGGPLFAGSLGVAGKIGVDLINNIAGDFATDQLLKISPKDLRKFWTGNKPNIENHHLYKALKRSLIIAMNATEAQYSEQLESKGDKAHLNAISNKIKVLSDKIEKDFDSLFNQTDDAENYITDQKILAFEEGFDDGLFTKFGDFLEVEKLEDHGPRFSNFFKEQFPYNILASFSKILKTDQNVWIAYQRLLLTDILSSNLKTEGKVDQVLNKIDVLKQQLELIEATSSLGQGDHAQMLWERLSEIKEYYSFSLEKLEEFRDSVENKISLLSCDLKKEFQKQDDFRQDTTRTLEELKKSMSNTPYVKGEANDEEYLLKKVLPAYLEWMLNSYQSIALPAIDSKKSRQNIPLEKVYVALQLSDEKTHEDFKYGSQLIKKKIKEAEANKRDNVTEEEKIAIRSEVLQQNPTLSNFKRSVLSAKTAEVKKGIVSLADVFQDERFLLILGDPGSGKSTLVKWLALQMTQGLLNDQERISVFKDKISIESETKEVDDIIDLGPVRLPILIKIPEYTKFYDEYKFDGNASNSSRGIIDYCGIHLPTLPKVSQKDVRALIKYYLKNNNAVVFLDGMDEVVKDRDKIIDEIERFIKLWVYAGEEFDAVSKPVSSGGNQLIVTSRIVGYHAAPLRSKVTQVYVREMDRVAIESFCDLWTAQVLKEDLSELDDKERQSLIIEESKALKQGIFDDSKPRIRELATNPLLVTILALLFKVKNNELPKSRVELYEQSISILMGKWKMFKESSQSISEGELDVILQSIAAQIHSSPSEDIREEKLKDLLEQELRLLREVPESSMTPISISDQVGAFVKVVKEDVGLLSERGESLYHFLHRTFQEYLAGKRLVVNARTATQNIVDRLSDPVWREPVLLSIAYANKYWSADRFNNLVDSLLSAEDELKDLVPRGILLIATALPDLDRLSPSIFEKLVREFLSAYGNREGIGRFESLRKSIKSIIDRLRVSDRKELFFNACKNLLKESIYTDVQWALISLCAKDGWYSVDWIPIVIEHLEEDSAEWDYGIDLMLNKHYSKDIDDVNNHNLKFREFLLKKPESFQVIINNPYWQRLVMVLYGGWKYDDTIVEYLDLKTKHHLISTNGVSENEKYDYAVYIDVNSKRITDALSEIEFEFKPKYIHRSSPFTRLLLRHLNAKKSPEDLVPIFEEIWKNGDNVEHRALALLSLGALGVNVLEIVNNADGNNQLTSTGLKRFSEHLRRIERNLLLPVIKFSDMCSSSRELQKFGWINLPTKYSSYSWSIYMKVLGRSGVPVQNNFASASEEIRKLYPNEEVLVKDNKELFFIREAESYMSFLNTCTDDVLYSVHVVLDVLGKKLKRDNSDFILEALIRTPWTYTKNNPYHLGWAMPKYWMPPKTEYEKLLFAIRVIDGLPENPINYDGLREFLVQSLWGRMNEYTDLKILALSLFVGKTYSEIVSNFFNDKLEGKNLEDVLEGFIPQIKDPYVRFMAALNFSRSVRSNKIEDVIFNSLELITDPEQWIIANLLLQKRDVYLIVLLKNILDGSLNEVVGKFDGLFDNKTLAAEILKRANSLKDAEKKFWAYMYIAEVCENEDRESIIFSAIDFILDIESDLKKGQALRLLNSKFKTNISGYPNWGNIYESFSDPFELNQGMNNDYLNLCFLHKFIAQDVNNFVDSTTAWSSLTTMAMVQDNQSEFDSLGLGNVVLESLINGSDNPRLWNKFLDSLEEGVNMNGSHVSLIDNLYAQEKESLALVILPYLEINKVSDLGMIHHWENAKIHELKLFWSLVNAEKGVLNISILDDLIDVVSNYDDRLSLRAQTAIHSKTPVSNNSSRLFNTSNVGLKTIVHLYDRALKLELVKPRVSSVLFWFNHNLIHDNPRLVDEYLKLYNDSEDETKLLAKKLLNSFECATLGVIQRIKQLLLNSDPKDAFQLWKSVAKLLYNQHSFGAFRSIRNSDLEDLLESENAKNALHLLCEDYEIHSLSIINEAFQGLKNNSVNDDVDAVVQLKDEIDKKSIITLNVEALSISELKVILGKIAKSFYYNEKRISKESGSIAEDLSENVFLIKVLSKLTIDVLENDLIDDSRSDLGGNLCLILAELTLKRPELMQTIISDGRSKSILIDTVKSSSSYVSRKGAIQILANLKKIDKDVLEALIYSLSDVHVVSECAKSNLKFFTEIIDEKTLNTLLASLNNSSGQIASETTKVLSNISAQSALDVQLRKKAISSIANLLRSQISDPSKRKAIYVHKSDVTTIFDGRSNIMLENKLEDVLYGELVKLTGL